MLVRRDLPLEEKLKILVKDLPISKDAKKNLLRQGVYDLDRLVHKFHEHPGRICLPFFSYKTFAEAGYLVVRMGFDGSHGTGFVSEGVWVRAATGLDKGIKKKIDAYVNGKVSYSGKRFL